MNPTSKKLTVGYFCSSNPLDKKAWSGTHFGIYQSLLHQGIEVVNLSPVQVSSSYAFFLRNYHRIHKLFSKKLLNEEHTFLLAFFSKLYFNKVVKQHPNIDAIIAPAGTTQIALLTTRLPIIYFNDTTVEQIKDYYNFISKSSKWSIKESNLVQSLALKNARKVVFCSNWAADFAKEFYKVPSDKVEVVRLGANIQLPETVAERDYKGHLNFLFLGVNWERKGGAIVFQTIQKLHDAGYSVKLIVCGCEPPIASDLIEYKGFLNKNNERDALVLKQLLATSHFLFVPTRAECYGIVFAEASAYGLLSITTATGGVPSIIEEGTNGFMLPIEAQSQDYYELLVEILKNPTQLQAMNLLSRKHYNQHLSWTNFGSTIASLCLEELHS